MQKLLTILGVTIAGIILMVAYRFIMTGDDFTTGLAIGLLFVFPLLALTFAGAVLLVGVVVRAQNKPRQQQEPQQPMFLPWVYPQQPQQHMLPGPESEILDITPTKQETPYEKW